MMPPQQVLTPMQIRILHTMIAGNSQADIAKQFNLSLRSIHQQVEAARRLTGCLNTAQLIAHFARNEGANEIKSA